MADAIDKTFKLQWIDDMLLSNFGGHTIISLLINIQIVTVGTSLVGFIYIYEKIKL